MSNPKKPSNFDEWSIRFLGAGINKIFTKPYSFKVWAFAPNEVSNPAALVHLLTHWISSKMQCNWLGERDAVPDLKRIAAKIIYWDPEEDWGPNKYLSFLPTGDTGGIWKAFANTLPPERLTLWAGWTISNLDPAAKLVTFHNCSQQSYECLISTMPLDDLARCIKGEYFTTSCGPLFHSSTHVVGIGVRGECPVVVARRAGSVSFVSIRVRRY